MKLKNVNTFLKRRESKMISKLGLIIFISGLAMQLDYRIQTPINTPNTQVFIPMIIAIIGMFMYLSSEKGNKTK